MTFSKSEKKSSFLILHSYKSFIISYFKQKDIKEKYISNIKVTLSELHRIFDQNRFINVCARKNLAKITECWLHRGFYA